MSTEWSGFFKSKWQKLPAGTCQNMMAFAYFLLVIYFKPGQKNFINKLYSRRIVLSKFFMLYLGIITGSSIPAVHKVHYCNFYCHLWEKLCFLSPWFLSTKFVQFSYAWGKCLEMSGIEPEAFRMRNGRSTTELHPPDTSEEKLCLIFLSFIKMNSLLDYNGLEGVCISQDWGTMLMLYIFLI